MHLQRFYKGFLGVHFHQIFSRSGIRLHKRNIAYMFMVGKWH